MYLNGMPTNCLRCGAPLNPKHVANSGDFHCDECKQKILEEYEHGVRIL